MQGLISSCATVPDFQACVEIHPAKAWCTTAISGKETIYDDKTTPSWWDLRPAMVLIPEKSYSELKSYIIKMCKKTKCDEKIDSWSRTIDNIDTKLNEKKLEVDPI